MIKEHIIRAYSKLINSDIVKKIYTMIDHIDIVEIKDNIHFVGYNVYVHIYLNDPTIDQYNMYQKQFDPHYLCEHYLKKMSKYLGIDVIDVNFKVFDSNGELILNWF